MVSLLIIGLILPYDTGHDREAQDRRRLVSRRKNRLMAVLGRHRDLRRRPDLGHLAVEARDARHRMTTIAGTADASNELSPPRALGGLNRAQARF